MWTFGLLPKTVIPDLESLRIYILQAYSIILMHAEGLGS